MIVFDICNLFFISVSWVVEDVVYVVGLCVILCNFDEDFEKEVMYLCLMEEECVIGVIFLLMCVIVEV